MDCSVSSIQWEGWQGIELSRSKAQMSCIVLRSRDILSGSICCVPISVLDSSWISRGVADTSLARWPAGILQSLLEWIFFVPSELVSTGALLALSYRLSIETTNPCFNPMIDDIHQQIWAKKIFWLFLAYEMNFGWREQWRCCRFRRSLSFVLQIDILNINNWKGAGLPLQKANTLNE